MASTGCPVVSLIRSFRFIAGTTANRSGSIPVQSKTSSAMSGRPLAEPAGPGADAVEELRDALPRLGSPVEALPQLAHPPGQLVARVDREQEMLDAVVGAGDEGRLHVRLDRAEQRVGPGDPVPRAQVEPALGGARRARVEPGHLAGLRAAQEERQPDRDLELVPVGLGHRVSGVAQVAVRYRAVPAAAGPGVLEEQVARAARAQQRGLLEIRYVAVAGRDR